ncbi:MAG TPA: threonine synthase [Atribacterota bacterium]|nr:threonine synthase [Atribacterota bacterium]
MLNKECLICTGCQKEYPLSRVFPRCDDCFEPLEVKICPSKIILKKSISSPENIIVHYHSFYSFSETNQELSLQEGFTPLTKANHLSPLLDLDYLYIKNETVNPTWSFKDRGTYTSLQHALSLGYKSIGTLSSGNMAVSVAAYGARAGIKTLILVSAELPPEKLNPILIYNPILIRVLGDYGQIYYESLKIGQELGIYFLNSDIPFRVEGSKSIAFELCQQLNYKVPDFVIIPTSSGGNARGIMKGFLEFYEQKLISKLPRIVAVQLEGCAPIYQAWIGKQEKISAVKNPQAIDQAIVNPFPPSGNELLRKLKKYNGLVTAVSDYEALQGQRMLAKEGIFAQPAAAVSIAAIRKLRKEGIINQKSRCVALVTGAGLKYSGVLEKQKFSFSTGKLKDLKGIISTKFQD